MALGVVYYATGISRPPANDNRVVSQDDAESSKEGATNWSSGFTDSGCENIGGAGTCQFDGYSARSEKGSSQTIKYADGSYVKTSESYSSGIDQYTQSGDGNPKDGYCGKFINQEFWDTPGWEGPRWGPDFYQSTCTTSSSSKSHEKQDYFYSDSSIESVYESSSTSSNSDSCGGSGSYSSGVTIREKYYNIGIETIKWGGGEYYTLTCSYSSGKTISPTPSGGQPEDVIEGPMNFGGAWGVTPEFLYGTTQTTGEFAGASLTIETKRTHYFGAYFEEENIFKEFTATYTDVAVSHDGESKIPFTFKSVVPTSWRNYRAINPGTTNYAAFLTPERYAKNGLALFFTQSPTKGQYLAAKNTDWETSFAISQVGIEAIEGIPPNNTGYVTVTYDMLTSDPNQKLSESNFMSSDIAFYDHRRFSTTNASEYIGPLGAVETTLKYITGHQFNTDVNGYYSSTFATNVPTTSMTTESSFNYFTSETTNVRSLFDTSKATSWISGAFFPTYTTSTASSTSPTSSSATQKQFTVGAEGVWTFCTNVHNESASGSTSESATGETRGSSFPLPYIATPALFLGKNKPSPRTPLALEGVAKGLGVPLDAPFKGATHDNTWAVFGQLGVENHARRFGYFDYYAENPGAYFIPYNGQVYNYQEGYAGNQIMSWNGSVTSVTLSYTMNGATKAQSKSAVISPSAPGSITRPVFTPPAWLNASPCASGRSITFADGHVMVTKSEYSAITGAPPDGTPILDADGISPYLASFSKMTINKVGGGDNAMPSIQFGAAIGHDSPASAAAYYWHA